MNFKKSSYTAPSAMLKFFANYAESPRFPLVCDVSPRATSFLFSFFFFFNTALERQVIEKEKQSLFPA